MILLFPFLVIFFLFLGLWLAHRGGRFVQQKYQHKLAYLCGFTLVFLLIFGDEIYTWTSWQRLCDTEGGVHVYKKVPVEGFFYDDGATDSSSGAVSDFLSRGYSYIEGHQVVGYDYKKSDGPLYRYMLDESEIVKGVPIEKPQSQYVFTRKMIERSHSIWAIEESVIEVATNKHMSTYHIFATRGGIVIKFLRHITGAEFEGSADYCGRRHFSEILNDLIQQTIPPIKSINKES